MNWCDSVFADSRHALRRGFGGKFWLRAMLVLAMLLPMSVAAKTVIVRDDPGGAVDARVQLLRTYARGGTRVEIREGYCLSACTMYLGLATTCIAPDTVFGFHGPSSRIYGISLPEDKFEHWSRIMAQHYPEPLKSWFMAKGRFRTVGFYKYSGQQLIDMGIPACTA